MFCMKCGTEIDDNAQFCQKCGVNVNASPQTTENSTERQRHGFTSFWLIFSLIITFIGGSIFLFSPQLITSYSSISSGLVVFCGVVSIVSIVGYILLLLWKKIGFRVLIGVSIISLPFDIALGMNIGQILWSIVGILILWGILHIRKNGKTTWEQLEDNNAEKKETKQEPVNPRFGSINTVIKETTLNDSLSIRAKTYRTLNIGEEVKIENIIDRRNDLGGIWALISTDANELGWCLLEALGKNS